MPEYTARPATVHLRTLILPHGQTDGRTPEVPNQVCPVPLVGLLLATLYSFSTGIGANLASLSLYGVQGHIEDYPWLGVWIPIGVQLAEIQIRPSMRVPCHR